MTDPYNYPMLRKDDTMYLSTISKKDYLTPTPYYRESTFLRHDITGTDPKILIPKIPNSSNFSLSTYIEPIPQSNKHINKTSNSLFIDDIEGARPKASQFRTNRIVDPLCPKYVLPSASEIVLDSGKKFLRNTLETQDINGKRNHTWQNRGKQIVKEHIEGSNPAKLTKQIHAITRFEVKDINKDGIFESARSTNPLYPSYNWRDNDEKSLNPSYGQIKGSTVRRIHPNDVNRPNNLCLGIKDIQGSQANSFYAKSHFVDKRREFRNYMATQDIQKSAASSLKKGIVTNRQSNPLVPNYKFPGHTQIPK